MKTFKLRLKSNKFNENSPEKFFFSYKTSYFIPTINPQLYFWSLSSYIQWFIEGRTGLNFGLTLSWRNCNLFLIVESRSNGSGKQTTLSINYNLVAFECTHTVWVKACILCLHYQLFALSNRALFSGKWGQVWTWSHFQSPANHSFKDDEAYYNHKDIHDKNATRDKKSISYWECRNLVILRPQISQMLI